MNSVESGNFLTAVPEQAPTEVVNEILLRPDVRIERIVSTGHTSPDGFWYDQAEDEWVLVLSGEAKLAIAGEPQLRHLRAGDWLSLPAHCRHRIEWTSTEQPTVWLAIFLTTR